MKLIYYIPLGVIALLIATPAFADENATNDGLINSEVLDLGGTGPFDHFGLFGDAGNSSFNNLFMTGGFNATDLRVTGTLTAVNPATWGSEGRIQINNSFQEEGFDLVLGTGQTYDGFPIDYDISVELGSLGGDQAGQGWEVQFYESFNDAGLDSQSTNFQATFQEFGTTDTDGVFSLGSIGGGDTASSIGEFATDEGLHDRYSITLEQAGFLSMLTDESPGGFTGTDADTEMAIFDSDGLLMAFNDDDPGNLFFSRIDNVELDAGDYTIAVSTFNTIWGDIGDSIDDVAWGTTGGTGDYAISASLVAAVPEPSSLALLGFGCVGLLAYRRRK